jgi:hypothetical protein
MSGIGRHLCNDSHFDDSQFPGRLFPHCIAHRQESKRAIGGVVPEFDVVSSLWLDIGAERRHYNNQIEAPPPDGKNRGGGAI